MDEWQWALIFPVIVKWGVVLMFGVCLWVWVSIGSKSDDECLKMGYKRNRR